MTMTRCPFLLKEGPLTESPAFLVLLSGSYDRGDWNGHSDPPASTPQPQHRNRTVRGNTSAISPSAVSSG